MKKLKMLEEMEKEMMKEDDNYSPDLKFEVKKLRESVVEKYKEICEFVEPMGSLE